MGRLPLLLLPPSSQPSQPPKPRAISSTSSTSTTPRCSTRVTGLPTRNLDHTTTTAPSPRPTTGRVPSNALSPGSAEVPDFAREVDGAPRMRGIPTPNPGPRCLLHPLSVVDNHQSQMIKGIQLIFNL